MKVITQSGRFVNPHNLFIDEIDIQDIAHSLSNQNRFNGNTRRFYSIAESAVFLSYMCNHEYALEGLLYHAPKSYIGDINRQLKVHLPKVNLMEESIWGVISAKYNLKITIPKSVMEAHDLLSQIEIDALIFGKLQFHAFGQNNSKEQFIERFLELTEGRTNKYEEFNKHQIKLINSYASKK